MIARTLCSATESILVVSLFSVCVCARARTCVRARACRVRVRACRVRVRACRVRVFVCGWVGGGVVLVLIDRCDLM